MPTPFNDVITRLEKQKATIERALAALREVDDSGDGVRIAQSLPGKSFPVKGARKGKRKVSAESRQRMAEGQRKRWAEKKASETAGVKKATSKSFAKKAAVKAE